MKTSQAITIALVAVGIFSGSAWGNSFSWTVSGGSVSDTATLWSSGPGNSATFTPAASQVGAVTMSGGCTGCIIHFSLNYDAAMSAANSDIYFDGGSFYVTGTLTDPGVGPPSFSGLTMANPLMQGTIGSFQVGKLGDKYSSTADLSGITFLSGLLKGFGLPAGVASGTFDLSWTQGSVHSGHLFNSKKGSLSGSLDLTVAPESATWLLLGSGLIVLGVLRRANRLKT